MSKKILYKGFHSIEEINYNNKTYEKIHIHDAVGAIVVNEDGEYALVSQYRPALGTCTYEIPAGLLDKDKSIEQILIEELQEECNLYKDIHYTSVPTKPAIKYNFLVGSSDARIEIYEITLYEKSFNQIIKNDDVDFVFWVSFKKFEDMVLNGLIVDSKTLMVYYYLKSKQN